MHFVSGAGDEQLNRGLNRSLYRVFTLRSVFEAKVRGVEGAQHKGADCLLELARWYMGQLQPWELDVCQLKVCGNDDGRKWPKNLFQNTDVGEVKGVAIITEADGSKICYGTP